MTNKNIGILIIGMACILILIIWLTIGYCYIKYQEHIELHQQLETEFLQVDKQLKYHNKMLLMSSAAVRAKENKTELSDKIKHLDNLSQAELGKMVAEHQAAINDLTNQQQALFNKVDEVTNQGFIDIIFK